MLVPAEITIQDDGKWVVAGPPPAPTFTMLTPASTGVIGQPCAWFFVNEVAWMYGWRVASLPTVVDGHDAIRVCTDQEWWTVTLNGGQPVGRWVSVGAVWVTGYGDRAPA